MGNTRSVTKTSFAYAAAITLLIAIACTVSALFVAPAYADNIKLNAPTTVSDDVTRLQVSKLDADTHEYVQGATMAIINAKTGDIVDSWVTGTGKHENVKDLDVEVEYILREIEAPEGYSKVDDVHFVVNETEGSGITIKSQGEGCELTESYHIALYDKPASGEEVVRVHRTTTVVAPKTGDETPLSVVAGIMAIGVLAIIGIEFGKRRID